MFSTVILKFNGVRYEKPLNELEVSDFENPIDSVVKSAMSQYLATILGHSPDLSDFVIDRHESVLNIRPSATYGNS